MEFLCAGADGVFRAFLTWMMPLKDPAGRVVRWFGTNTNISERKQNEERLALQAEELRRLASIASSKSMEEQFGLRPKWTKGPLSTSLRERPLNRIQTQPERRQRMGSPRSWVEFQRHSATRRPEYTSSPQAIRRLYEEFFCVLPENRVLFGNSERF
jgi:hypothetical protein